MKSKNRDNMDSTERVNYTDSLLCLMDKPAKTPSDLAPGAKTRYDDWVVTHINQTLNIHSTVSKARLATPPLSLFLYPKPDGSIRGDKEKKEKNKRLTDPCPML